jgi:hypothetical protein
VWASINCDNKEQKEEEREKILDANIRTKMEDFLSGQRVLEIDDRLTILKA